MPLSRRLFVGAMFAAAAAFSPAWADVKVGVEAWQNGNYPAAVREWRPLAEQGDPDAQFNMGQAYKLGRGVPADLTIAQSWYEKAAEQDHEEAQANLGLILFQNGQQEQAMAWIRKAADKGDPRARYLLATALFNGDMMAKDWPRAYSLMSRAAAQGLLPAIDSLSQMENVMPEAERQQGMKLARDLARLDADREAAAGPAVPPPAAQAPKPATRTPQVASVVPSKSLPTTPTAPQPAPVKPVAPSPPASEPSVPPQLVSEPTAPQPPAPQPEVAAGPQIPPQPTPVPATPERKAIAVASAQSPARAPAKPRPTSSAASLTSADGRWRVQLGAYGSVELAKGQWAMLSKKVGALAGLRPSYEPVGALIRLRINALTDRSAAEKLCAAAKAAGQGCFAIAP